ncbi:MAG: glycosyltransferase [Candidatus Woesearchaeota archaeon]
MKLPPTLQISTYPPTRCGLATWAKNVRGSLIATSAGEVHHVATVEPNWKSPAIEYAPEVQLVLDNQDLPRYRDLADAVNGSGYGAVLLQHEFGIFGGEYGGYILEFLKNVDVPIVTTTHTVLSNDPIAERKRVFQGVVDWSDLLLPISRTAQESLEGQYGANGKVIHIHHGAYGLDKPKADSKEVVRAHFSNHDLSGEVWLLSNGLIRPDKGIEYTLEALALLDRNLDYCFIVAGQTHPTLIENGKDPYRESLEELVRERRLGKRVTFINEYNPDDIRNELLNATDMGVQSYPGKDQISSGITAEFLRAGISTVATDFDYAKEVLEDDRGVVVSLGHMPSLPSRLAEAIWMLYHDKRLREEMGSRAREFAMEHMDWVKAVAPRTREVLMRAAQSSKRPSRLVEVA